MKNIIIISAIIIGFFALIGVGGYTYFVTITNEAQQKTQENLARAKEIYDSIPIWHKKINTNQELKIGIITDTHVHPTRINKNDKSESAPRRLKDKDVFPMQNFVSDMKSFQPDFIVHLGDVIEGTDDEDYIGIMGLEMVRDKLQELGVPMHWVIGNHDLRSVTKEQFEQILGLDSVYYSFDMGDYRFVVLDGNYDRKNVSRTPTEGRYIRGHLPPEQLEWLKEQLATNKQTFVFMHQGAFLDDSVGDYDEDKQKNKMKQSIDNADELQAIFDEYRVAGFYNGHMEARKYKKKNWTAYNSLTGTKKSYAYPDSYYELIIKNNISDITMYYLPEGEVQIKKVDFESSEK